jgi:uncharacterized protein (DUF2249 family)
MAIRVSWPRRLSRKHSGAAAHVSSRDDALCLFGFSRPPLRCLDECQRAAVGDSDNSCIVNTPSASTAGIPLEPSTTTIDVRGIAHPARHAAILAAFRALRPADALELVVDHDPTPLYRLFQVEAPGNFAWVYAQRGPEIWRVRVQKLGRSYSAGECCGVCGGQSDFHTTTPSRSTP